MSINFFLQKFFRGCILYKEGLFAEAIEKFNSAVQLGGSKAPLSYNIALCYYQLRQYAQALKHIADIIERGIKEHPELSVGLTTEGTVFKKIRISAENFDIFFSKNLENLWKIT